MDLSALTVDEADNTLKTLSISNSFTVRDSVSLASLNNLSVVSTPSNWAETHMSSGSFHTDNTVDLAMIVDDSVCAVDDTDTFGASTMCVDGAQYQNNLYHSTGKRLSDISE